MKILVSPSLDRGVGAGHLLRCRDLVEAIGNDAQLLVYGDNKVNLLADIPIPKSRMVHAPLNGDSWDIILFDRKATPPDELQRLSSFGVPIGLDEGGSVRKHMPYLIDSLPRVTEVHRGNICSLDFLNLPTRRVRELRYPFQKLLVAFGGEDLLSLTEKALNVLRDLFPLDHVTAVRGPAFQKQSWPKGIHILENPGDLKNCLYEYDLIVTSFGLTCFEGLASGIPVLLLNPSYYHQRLARKAGIPTFGLRRPSKRKLLALLEDRDGFIKMMDHWRKILGGDGPDLVQWLNDIEPDSTPSCPVCGSCFNTGVARFPKRTYFSCRRCGILYLLSFEKEKIRYDESYFTDEYRRQYGRTYLEDFQKIASIGADRIRTIKRIKPPSATLLDVGCAYGPFLSVARQNGYEVRGNDVSSAAIRYVRDELHIPCDQGDFERIDASGVDILTMWFVLEHFRAVDRVLRKVNQLLHLGGVFAFSTPNGRGVSGRLNLQKFLEKNPRDHTTIWSPHGSRKVLRNYGFRIRYVKVTGHHPERMIGERKLQKGSFFWRLLYLISRITGLGDTFEIYAVKTRQL